MSAERLPLLKAAYGWRGAISSRSCSAARSSSSCSARCSRSRWAGSRAAIGATVDSATASPQIGIAMQAADVDAMLGAQQRLQGRLGGDSATGRAAPARAWRKLRCRARFSNGVRAALPRCSTGTPATPVLTAPPERLQAWSGPVALIAAEAQGRAARLPRSQAPRRSPPAARASSARGCAPRRPGSSCCSC